MPTIAELPYWFIVALATSLGLSFGSFLNVVIYRLPRGRSLSRPGSSCPGCGAPIRPRDNIPILSWLWLRGRARCCKAPISARYPAVELAGGLLAWAIVERIVLPLPGETSALFALGVFSVHLALGLGLIAAAFIDLEHMVLPDSITLGGAALGLLSLPLRPELSVTEALIGGVVGFLMVWLPFDVLYRALRGQTGMGLGDAKLLLLAGVWFGWPGALFTLLAGAVQGTLTTIALFAARGRVDEPEAVRLEREELERQIEAATGAERRALEAERDQDPLGREPEPGLRTARLAFGPFLVLALLEYLLFGDVLVALYLDWVWG